MKKNLRKPVLLFTKFFVSSSLGTASGALELDNGVVDCLDFLFAVEMPGVQMRQGDDSRRK